jgi:Na+(H+)/acetate symporter ActP
LIQLLFGLDVDGSRPGRRPDDDLRDPGGMKATTCADHQAALLLMGATFMAGAVLYKFGFSPEALFAKATEVHPKGPRSWNPAARSPIRYQPCSGCPDVRHSRAATHLDASSR